MLYMENGIGCREGQRRVEVWRTVYVRRTFGRRPSGRLTALLAAVAIAAGASATGLGSVVFSGADAGNNLSASAGFTLLGGGDLQITLTNTYAGDTADQSHVLTGLFFSGANGLTPVSATAGAGTVEWSGHTSSAPPGPAVLGTEWAYGTPTHGPNGATAGIESSGAYVPIGTGNFASPGDMLDGSAYGLLSTGYAGSDGDGLSTRVYIQDSMVFVLTNFSGTLAGITDVTFTYGTSTSEPLVAGTPVQVPEPAMPALLSVALCGLWLLRRGSGR
jgi:hypothetical protein